MVVDLSRYEAQANRILEAIQGSQEEWLSRRDIARLLGKKQLNPVDITGLDWLVSQGKLTVEKQEAPGGIGFSLVYKLAQKGK
jgi:hypothetical protein